MIALYIVASWFDYVSQSRISSDLQTTASRIRDFLITEESRFMTFTYDRQDTVDCFLRCLLMEAPSEGWENTRAG